MFRTFSLFFVLFFAEFLCFCLVEGGGKIYHGRGQYLHGGGKNLYMGGGPLPPKILRRGGARSNFGREAPPHPLPLAKTLTKVVVYGDGSHGSLPTGASQGANMVFLSGNGRCAPIAWKSKKLDRVTKSPLASEVSAISDAADSGFLVASIVKEIYKLESLPKIELRTDSKSLKEHLGTTKVIQDPRLRVDTARLREMTNIGEVEVTWVSTEFMLADCLTKKDASSDLLRQVLASGMLPENL